MQSYRCFLLDHANSIVEWTEFPATNDSAADGHAAAQSEFHPRAVGYSLWQSGRLVAERLRPDGVTARPGKRHAAAD